MKYTNWKIPRHILDETERALLRGEHEVFAIWSAALRGGDGSAGEGVVITRCIVPAQKPGVAASGVWVHIEGQELQRIQLDNHRRQERSVVQLHSHPGGDVNMSALDREWEVVRHVGALSIIVPNYCKRGLSAFDGVNVYEREEDDWRLWSRREVVDRLVVS